MADQAFRYAALALKVLEKILGSKFSVSGIENLPSQPVLFVANHFTRSETFFIPYIIYKHTGRQVRCLADSSLYHGTLGKFLNSVGAISTKNPNRDNIILKDLITGQYDWMIYPEGSMMKSKETKKESAFINYTPSRVGPVRTGSAVLALKSELYRSEMADFSKKNQAAELEELQKKLGVNYQQYFDQTNTCIVPLNITYYPIRPGNNKIKNLAAKFIKKIPDKIAEELEIEGNILLGAEINISFGAPINLGNYVKTARTVIGQIPLLNIETKNNLVLKYFKYRLTEDFMSKVYCDVQVNLDHIFSASLKYFPQEKIEIYHLKRIIYLSALMISKVGKYHLNQSIFEENLIKMFIDEPHEEFDSAFELARKQNLISDQGDGFVTINKKSFEKNYDFNEIRRENTLQVIANEFSLLEKANSIVKKNAAIANSDLRKLVFDEIYKRDLEIFESDYEIYFDEKFSKDKAIGSPFFLNSSTKTISKIKRTGILVCHGYKSAPQEVAALAKYLNGFGFRVYGVRLKGHGTSPINMKDVTYDDWYDSLQRGYAALKNICSKVIIVGFSTGGLLSLLSCSRKKQGVCALVAINSALKLLNIKARMVPGINIWNEMLVKLNIEKGRMEYVDDNPENPAINYSRNYLKGVEQLGKLMELCDDNLKNISVPTLIIQANKDPIVNPISGKLIFEKIKSENKFLIEPDFSNHIIINSEGKEEIFESIRDFLYKLKLL